QTDVLWWRENSLPLRQLFGSDGRILDIKFQSENKKENWISKKPEIANDNINKIKNKSLKQTKKIIVEMLKINENSNDNNPALIAEPKNIQHPVRFYEKGDSPIEYIYHRGSGL
ncbi:MAG: hypothetical protein P8K05_07115, partial [Dehalococcoidia bacterium]|nr:hypothetical protein [Dehalococcoidia bacterium]